MRNRILGAIGVIWGSSALYQALTKGVSGDGSYATGQRIGYLFGFLMLLVGAYYLLKGDGASKN
jgi:hypothetical protein